MPEPEVHHVLGNVAGLMLVAVPGRLRRRIEEERMARLAELEAGAEESCFEEKRSLQAYPLPVAEILRAGGLIPLGVNLALLWSYYSG